MKSLLDNVLSVSELNHMVKNVFTDAIGHVWITGEISNFSRPLSGHWYFTLKDEVAQVRCVMFHRNNCQISFVPDNGVTVLVHAAVTLYESRGEYQLIIEKMQVSSVGLLQQRFEQLKVLLQKEGLFADCQKKTLPTIISCVGIINSPTGAALYDICHILKRRDPAMDIIIYPSLVQGEGAADQIARMITIANDRNECDVLIVARGGGSLEDLWPFNEERVARAIFSSKLPIISAVGHEVDFTIADFVADIRAATPSAAAELVSKNVKDQLERLQNMLQRLSMAMDYFLLQREELFKRYFHRLSSQHPKLQLLYQQTVLLGYKNRLFDFIREYFRRHKGIMDQLSYRLILSAPVKQLAYYQRLDEQLQQRISFAVQREIGQKVQSFFLLSEKLSHISPLTILSSGYAIVSDEKERLISSSKQVSIGQKLRIQLEKGTIISQVIETK